MTEDQATEMISVLSEILYELKGLKTDFLEFTGYNVYNMSTAINDIGDRICGNVNGIGGATLAEVVTAIDQQ